MRQLIWSFALAVLLAPAALSQPFFFSEPAPLTTMRYEAAAGVPRLLTNGVQPYLLWTLDTKVRITPLTGIRRVGRPVLDAYAADAVWTGTHFLVVGIQGPSPFRYAGRLVGADGEAIGEPFTIATGEPVGDPHLAFDGRRVLLVYGSSPARALELSRNGQPLEEPRKAPVDATTAVDADVTARSEEFLAAIAGGDRVIVAGIRNGAWTQSVWPASPSPARSVAIAANASTALTIWSNEDAPLEARLGQASFTLAGTANARAVDVTWDGRDFIYAYRIGSRLSFRYFNAALPFTTVDVAPDSPVRLLSVNGRTYGAWLTAGTGSPLVVRDLATLGGDDGAFAASTQWLQTSASSPTAALFAWHERDGRLYAGVRTAAGGWSESQIANEDEQAPLAASDGSGFVLIQATPSEPPNLRGWTATLLDAQANVQGLAPRVPFYPTGIAWTGSAYAIVGLNASQHLVASLLSPSGTVTAPVVIAVPRTDRSIQHAAVTSRGNELLVVWSEARHFVCFPPCGGVESDILGARLTPALQRVDTQSLLLASPFASSPDALWDGTRYVITWSDEGTIQYRTLRTNSAVSGVSSIAGASSSEPRLTLVPGGVALTADDGKVVFLRDGGESVVQLGVNGRQALAMLGNRLAYVQSLARDEVPYHGAYRLNIRIGDLAAPSPKPSAPRITRADLLTASNIMLIEWTAPPETVNGYRVEYRVDEGVWNELDEWLDSRTTELTIRPWRADPARYQFRVRAVNDAGFGPYSGPATVRPRKLRAVR
jgi:hypothetical protein